jgi:hypothetical protein
VAGRGKRIDGGVAVGAPLFPTPQVHPWKQYRWCGRTIPSLSTGDILWFRYRYTYRYDLLKA